MTGDVVAILLDQHRRIKRLFADILDADGTRKEGLFHELVRLLAVHENAEALIVHPAARELIPNGDAVVGERLREEADAERALAALCDLGLGHAEFDRRLGRLSESVLGHAAQEEYKEFAQLRRRAGAERLRRMAAALDAAERAAPPPSPGQPVTATFDEVGRRMRAGLKGTTSA
ncbi:hemerythrin domain-containing protein [Dactylosporangium sp. CA-092794]|uniref:hemerythrin domain-containing protein n=1 Tax=Dactylosporangium sp. CA-092794 TaxID=3239929 RepID=UPI003D939C74